MRDRINQFWSGLPRGLQYALAFVLVGGSVGLLLWRLRGSEPAVPAALAAQTVYRECRECRHIESESGAEVYKKGYVGIEMAKGPMGEGRRCPKCQKNTMVFIKKCPRCATTFDPYNAAPTAKAASGHCPKCGWDSLADRAPGGG